MAIFKRITTTVSAAFEKVADQVENHDAIVEASISEIRKKAAQTKSRLNTLRNNSLKLKEQLKKVNSDYDKWTDRARSLATENPEKAKLCLRRRQQCKAHIDHLQTTVKDSLKMEHQVAENLIKIERALAQTLQKHNILRSRASVAQANKIMTNMANNNSHTLEDTMQRWEATIIENEMQSAEDFSADSFEDDFIAEEIDAELDIELKELLEGNTNG